MEDLPSWDGAKRVGIDIETRDPHLDILGPSVRRGGYIVGVSFTMEDGESFYLPTRHEAGDNLDEEQVMRYLKTMSKCFRGTLVGANLNYDLDYLAQVGINFSEVKWQRDVQVAEPLIDELQLSYSLDRICGRYQMPGKDETLLRQAAEEYGVNPKKDLWKLPARYVGPYAEVDSLRPLQLLRRQERIVEEQDLWEIFDLECRLQPVLLRVKRRGVRIDLNKLEHIEDWSMKQETEQLNEVHRLTGVRVGVGDVWKAEVMAAPLIKLGVDIPRTKKDNKLSITAEFLDELDHPAAKCLARARKVNKLRTTFAQSIRNHMENGDRIHCTLNQLRRTKGEGDSVGGRYGRLSSEHPNIQQQPSRDDFASLWRSIYVPDHPGQLWICADYSQAEPRILTHFAELMHLPKAFEAAEKYRNDPSTDNHQMMADLCGLPGKKGRKQAKVIYLGICYGMGGAKLANDLGLPTKLVTLRNGRKIVGAGDEAQIIIDKFNQGSPFVKMLAKAAERRALEVGYIVTVLGRRCRFPKDAAGNFDWCHKALNRLIQGSSADQMKKAMVEVDAAGLPIQMSIHDEIDSSVDSVEQGNQIAKIMRTCVELTIPSKVDLEIGPSWGGVK